MATLIYKQEEAIPYGIASSYRKRGMRPATHD